MKKFLSVLSVFAIVGAVVISYSHAQGDKTPTVKEIMGKVAKGALPKVGKALKAEKPDWKSVKKGTETIAKYTKFLADNDPPRGEKDDWKEKADAFYDAGKALDDAAKDEDLDKARDSLKKMGASCKACHDAHKKAK